MVFSVFWIQHFLGILAVTEFQATKFHENLFPGYTAISILVPANVQEIPGKFFCN